MIYYFLNQPEQPLNTWIYICFSHQNNNNDNNNNNNNNQKKSFQIFSVLLSQLLTFIKGIGLFGAGCFQIFRILLIRGLFRLRLFQVAWLVTKVTKPWSSWWLNQPIWTIRNRQIGSFKGVKIQRICETNQPVIAFLKNNGGLYQHLFWWHSKFFQTKGLLTIHKKDMAQIKCISSLFSEGFHLLFTMKNHQKPKTLQTSRQDQTSWWFQPIWKYISQIGSSPQIGMNIKKISNHHPRITLQEPTQPTAFGWSFGLKLLSLDLSLLVLRLRGSILVPDRDKLDIFFGKIYSGWYICYTCTHIQ